MHGGDISVERARILSDSVRTDLASSGFTANDDKSIWEPTKKLVFLGSILDFGEGLIWEAISVKSGMRSRLVGEKSIAMVEFIDW